MSGPSPGFIIPSVAGLHIVANQSEGSGPGILGALLPFTGWGLLLYIVGLTTLITVGGLLAYEGRRRRSGRQWAGTAAS